MTDSVDCGAGWAGAGLDNDDAPLPPRLRPMGVSLNAPPGLHSLQSPGILTPTLVTPFTR